MTQDIVTSIIITSFNYGRFLKNCIDSALAQTYGPTEVIVVDDGSTDNSREIIASYGQRVISVLKSNGGQASAFNAGFRISRGELICFMDSDDLLLPPAMENAVAAFDENTSKIHWPLWYIDAEGKRTGEVMHGDDLPEGDLSELLIREGPAAYNWPTTSGNVWSRTFLDQVYPLPETEFTIGPDSYLSSLAPLFGHIKAVKEPQGCYRLHSHNNSFSFSETLGERIRFGVERWNLCFEALSNYCRKLGIKTDREQWKKKSWWHQSDAAIKELLSVVPVGATLMLAGKDQWVADATIAGRSVVHFTEAEEGYGGPPADDEAGILEFEKLRRRGIDYIVFPWWSSWWLEYYSGLNQHIRSRYGCLVENERLTIFNLRKS